MGVTAASDRGRWRLRRPRAGETIELLAFEGLVLGIGAAVVGATSAPTLRWAVVGIMLLVLAYWVAGLRDHPAGGRRGAGGSTGYTDATYARTAGAGLIGFGAYNGGGGFGGGFDGGGGGGGDGGGGGC